ncbi:TIGR02186 family protein [Phaeovibrio sulfidiphilus]|uniref:TIGR02186 family protein n=1 Tax=Phaeovibrio sulfidiphilus TaxID=1220600 RepID=A0A8J6YNW2_9PROT|nr:TIGR02186 family protein [Phaeovibrio sulfidiphilus]
MRRVFRAPAPRTPSAARAVRVVTALVVLLAVAGLTVPGARARSGPFIVDLSRHQVSITTAYAGTEVLLFGTADVRDADVVMVVRGPAGSETVRRKTHKGPLWVYGESVDFRDAPGFYQVASTRPLDAIAGPAVLAGNQIGTRDLELATRTSTPMDPETLATFREAFLSLKRDQGLYAPQDVGATPDTTITVSGDTLFQKPIRFPANAPLGRYTVDIYLFRDGNLESVRQTPLSLDRSGISADLYDLAMNRPYVYGISSVLVALLAGWLAGQLASRRT